MINVIITQNFIDIGIYNRMIHHIVYGKNALLEINIR